MISAELHLPAEPAAASEARRWLRQHLKGWPEPACGDAQLLVSELVTNAVLHARTPILVRVRCGGGRARVEVGDEAPGQPVIKRVSTDATTGRGLQLLDTLSTHWGVEAASPGKRVWFELEGGPPPEDATRRVPVRILGLPLGVYLQAAEHNDAMLRELALLAARPDAADVPGRLLEMASELSARFAGVTGALRASIEAAAARGEETVDVQYEVEASSFDLLMQVADDLDEADRWCEEGDLLTVASPPKVRRFRRWYAEEVRRQLGVPHPRPWPAEWR